MRETQLAYATRLAPRYTSYPTAPHFTESVGAADYEDWLSRLHPSTPVSLYAHIPFCRQICWYCGCNMKLAKREGPLKEYADTLIREIDMIADRLPARMRVSHLHFGGGTPTALQPRDLARIVEKMNERFDFTEGAERAIESDPRTLTSEMSKEIGALGFTRASFGVQEFNARVQAAINRVQPVEMVRRSVDELRAAGISGINFDLIYGLPHQTKEMMRDTIEKTAEIGADRCALFAYAHVPWMAKRQRRIDAAALPGAGERFEMALAGAEAFERAGYNAIGIDHFAKPEDPLALAARQKRLQRNFQGYTTDTAATMLGFGATSIGKTPFGYVQNTPEPGAWSRQVNEGVAPIAKGRALTEEDRLRGHIIERLMCDGEVDLSLAQTVFGAPARCLDASLDALKKMEHDGALTVVSGKVRVTQAGRPFTRVVAAAFDAYLEDNAARHSVAV